MAPSPGSEHLEVSGTFNQMSDRSHSIRADFSALGGSGPMPPTPFIKCVFFVCFSELEKLAGCTGKELRPKYNQTDF